MNIINQSVEIIPKDLGVKKKIELCGRVCYKSESKITEDSAERFVNALIKRGHTSVLEHARIRIDGGHYDPNYDKVSDYIFCAATVEEYGSSSRIHADADDDTLFPYLEINCRDYLAILGKADFDKYPEADDYMTVRFTTNRAIANELVRHRVFSFSQESTRYCSYKDGVTFIADDYTDIGTVMLEEIEAHYQYLLDNGAKPEIARNILPLCTKTELVMTGTYNQWFELLKLRMPKAAHPQIRELMTLLVNDKNFPKELQVPNISHE